MSEARETEIRALKDLRACDGWQVFTTNARDQWQGEKFVGRLKVAMRATPNAESVKEVFAGREAIESLLNWPEQRLKKLEADAAADLASMPVVERRA